MINIAIDGPAGAGKSTIAKAVAKELGIVYLDTGAMYRSVAYYALKKGFPIDDEKAIQPMLDNLKMDVVNGEVQQFIVNGENVTPFIREHSVSKAASDVSKLFNVRKKNAIKKAQQLANEQRRKFLVLNFKGKPTVVSVKQIKFWISTKQVNKDADYFREMALYTAMSK